MSTTNEPIFVSYAHDNPKHEELVLDFCDELCYNYINCNCDQYVEDGNPERGWPNWMEENLRISKFVIVIASKKYIDKFEGKEEAGKGLGAKWESTLSANEIYQNDSKNTKYIPVVFDDSDTKHIPTFLQSFTHYNVSRPLDLTNLIKRLKGEYKSRKPELGSRKKSVTPLTVNEGLLPNPDKAVNDNITLPDIPQFTENMKPGMKILQAYFVLPITSRFSIASELHLVEEGEAYENSNADELTGKFLVRAKERDLLAELWSKLFDENIDPNPFKN